MRTARGDGLPLERYVAAVTQTIYNDPPVPLTSVAAPHQGKRRDIMAPAFS